MAEHRPTRPVRILMVEDDPADARLTLESLRDSHLRNDVTVAGTGEEALARLRDETGEATLRPDLILLDINLPGRSGLEVLEELKSDAALTTIPVVMLTTSDEEADIVASYQQHAAAYVQKPMGLDGFTKIVDAIEQFWFEVVLLPPRED